MVLTNFMSHFMTFLACGWIFFFKYGIFYLHSEFLLLFSCLFLALFIVLLLHTFCHTMLWIFLLSNARISNKQITEKDYWVTPMLVSLPFAMYHTLWSVSYVHSRFCAPQGVCNSRGETVARHLNSCYPPSLFKTTQVQDLHSVNYNQAEISIKYSTWHLCVCIFLWIMFSTELVAEVWHFKYNIYCRVAVQKWVMTTVLHRNHVQVED